VIAPKYVEPQVEIDGMRGPDYPMDSSYEIGRYGAPNWGRVIVGITNHWADPITIDSCVITLLEPAGVGGTPTLNYMEANWTYNSLGGNIGGPLPGVECCGRPSHILDCTDYLPQVVHDRRLAITVLYGLLYALSPYSVTWQARVDVTVSTAGGQTKTMSDTTVFS
jgi:hypothetical protein